jgi:hypothetical protein
MYKEMFKILSHIGNTNKNDTVIPSPPTQKGIIKKKKTTNADEDSKEKGTHMHCWWECKLVQY